MDKGICFGGRLRECAAVFDVPAGAETTECPACKRINNADSAMLRHDKHGGTANPNLPAAPAGKHPDGNPKSLQGAKKYSLRYLPLAANIAVNQALEDGAGKYGPANWREDPVAASVYIDAALRHISQYFDGKQDNAEDSGVPNLGHAMGCLAILVDAAANGTLIDDRPHPTRNTDALLKRPESNQ